MIAYKGQGYCKTFRYNVYFQRTVKIIMMLKERQLLDNFANPNRLSSLLPENLFAVRRIEREPFRNTDIVADIDSVYWPNEQKRFAIEVKNTDRIAPLREAAMRARESATTINAVPMVAGRFFGERARQVLKSEGVGYIDEAKNFYLNVRDPRVVVEYIVPKNPFSDNPPLKNVFAPTSSRIARAMLIEPERSWTISELSKETEVSLGQTYSVLEKMSEEELARKDTSGKWIVASPAALLEAWKKVYPSYQNRLYRMYSFASTADIPKLVMQAGKDANIPYALAFFSGADLIAPFIRGLSKVQLYTTEESIEVWKQQLGLKEVDSGGNIELYVPYDKGVFYKLQEYQRDDGVVNIVSNVQLYMDLFNDPARGEEAAEQLRRLKLGY